VKRIVVVLMVVLFISGCNSTDGFDSAKLDEFEVTQPRNETTGDDFIFRLISEKEVYEIGEEVELYGEIEYIGDKDEITINHASSAIHFSMIERVREYNIYSGVQDIGVSTTLEQGESYQKKYTKDAGFYSDRESEDYVAFIEDFWNRDDFPPGYYEVNGVTDFTIDTERIELEASIDFKVVE